MFDGKSEAKMSEFVWVIRHIATDEIVFEYRTYQGNKKKALFNSSDYAENALNKYIKNPENYYVCKVM